jgi:taurine dioxygenase
MRITPSGQACGAEVSGIDLSQPLSAKMVATLRTAWLEHLVLSFPDQQLSDDDLERFTLAFGAFGEDPFIAPLPGRAHVIAIQRAADETTPIFAEAWHTDWSFQAVPPDGTCLYGLTIPPVGGDTLFANQQKALAEMPAALRAKLEGVTAVHSARAGYAPDGVYGANDPKGPGGRSMDIRPSDAAQAVQRHPLIRSHPETGVPAIYGAPGYVVALEGAEDAQSLMMELYQWQTQERFVYRHRWQPGMLIMWDNRALLHRATGGYDGHDRLLHRTTIGGTRF